MCTEYKENVERLTQGCHVLVKNEYIKKHDKNVHTSTLFNV